MKKLALIILAALTASACVTLSSTYKLGTKAEIARQFDEASLATRRPSWSILRNPSTVWRSNASNCRPACPI